MIRLLFKTIFGIIIIALAIYGGIYAYFQLKTIENIQNTDIFEAIPTNPEMILILHSPKRLIETWNTFEKFSDLLPEKESLSVVDAIGKAQVCSERCIDKEALMMSYYPEGTLLFLRMKRHDFEYMERKFFSANLSVFAPKEEIYRDARIFIRATCSEDFFCYTLYNNIFIGSFEKRLVHRAIDAFIDKNGLRADSLSTAPTMSLLEKLDKKTLAGLFINYQKRFPVFKTLIPDTLNYWIAGNVQIKNQALEISGFLPVNHLEATDLPDIDSTISLNFNPAIIPLSANYFFYTNDKTKSFSENINVFMRDTSIFDCLQNEIAYFKFAKNDSLQVNHEAVFFSSTCPDKFFKDKEYIVGFNENKHILFKNKEAQENYIKQIENKQNFEQNQTFQMLFRQYYDKDIREIIWTQQTNSSVPYNFLMLNSPNQTDKFYTLLIYQEP